MQDKAVEAIKRHFDVVAESLGQDIKLIAEGHGILNGKIDEFRKENAKAHEEILSAVKFSYAELDRRLVGLENKYTNLEKRLSRLESLR